MNTFHSYKLLLSLATGLFATLCLSGYDNFKTAIYCPVRDVEGMADQDKLEQSVQLLQRHFSIDKVYLETHRRNHLIDHATLQQAIDYFHERGIETAGGITTTGERAVTGRFGLFCYTTEEELRHFEKVIRFTARHFDELILDDFYFTDCRCENCISAKGDRSWEDFRTQLMADISRDIVVKAAREENPNIKLVIKYPNWYDYFQYTGYNLQDQPEIFDGLYTGTETRDAVYHQQHLQPYHGYLLMRYIDNIAPGRNGGGWVDPLVMRTLNRYGEQLSLTLFGKAEEVMLFRWGSLIEWIQDSDNRPLPVTMNAAMAGYVFSKTDAFLGKLGDPIGMPVYKPVNSTGEPFLPTYLGMLGLPLDLVPAFPQNAHTVLLTRASAYDPMLLEKMKKHLTSGRNLVITSGLLEELKDKGIEDITTISYSDGKISAHAYSDLGFNGIFRGDGHILLPRIDFPTNDAWKEVAAIAGDNSYPLVTQSEYGGGLLRVLTIPDDLADLYKIPREALMMVRELISADMPMMLDAPSKVSLFLYDNNTCIVHSFLPHKTKIRLLVNGESRKAYNLLQNEELETSHSGSRTILEQTISPYSYQVIKWK